MNFHERFDGDVGVIGPSSRSFGLTVGGILLAVGLAKGLWAGFFALEFALVAVGLVLTALALVWPAALTVPNKLWTRFGLLLYRIVNSVVMLVMYATCIVPLGLVLRLFGYDPLKRKFDQSSATYWMDKKAPDLDKPMKYQF